VVLELDYYKHFTNQHQSTPLFFQPWWLEAATGGDWGAACVLEEDTVHAVLPYHKWRRAGFTFLSNPPLTPRLGLHFAHPYTLHEQGRLTELVHAQLPHHSYAEFHCHYGYDYWQPLGWQGWEQTTLYSYQLQPAPDASIHRQRFNQNTQRNLRKAEEQLTVREFTDVFAFYDLVQASFERRKAEVPYSLTLLTQLDAAATTHAARRLLFAVDAVGRLHAAAYLVHDANTVYYLAGGMEPALKDSGAMTLLLWHSIQWASETGRVFDFEGSADPGIAHFFQGFGARPRPYHCVWHYGSRLLRWLHELRQ